MQEATSRRAKLFADVESASAAYFHTMGILLLKGREFTRQDGERTPPVAVISKSLANRFRSGQDPIGRRLKLGPRESAKPWLTIVGVVGDVRQFVLDTKPPAKIYVSSLQSPDSSMSLVIRTAVEPDQLAPGVRGLLATIDPKLPVTGVKPMDEFIDEQAAGIGIASELVGKDAGEHGRADPERCRELGEGRAGQRAMMPGMKMLSQQETRRRAATGKRRVWPRLEGAQEKCNRACSALDKHCGTHNC